MSEDVIRTSKHKDNGVWITNTYKNGVLIRSVPTDPSQIPQHRKSLLWTHDSEEPVDFDELDKSTSQKMSYAFKAANERKNGIKRKSKYGK